MLWYVLKLLILLPLIAGLAWGCLKLAQKLQQRTAGNPTTKSVRVIETVMLSPTLKLAVIEFRGREILVSASRQGLVRLAETEARGPIAGELA
jgi:flagellar protein FliO/FliZ